MISSFRDPAGCCFDCEGRVLRVVYSDACGDLARLLDLPITKEFCSKKKLVESRALEKTELQESSIPPEIEPLLNQHADALLIEHEKIPFTSYAYEWCPAMLLEAARLTLDLAQAFLEAGYGLKDATPSNILFRGPTAVFVDLLSFERRDPHDPIWLPYGQFLRTFLLPLALNQTFRMSLADVFINRRDGVEPNAVYEMCGFWQRLSRPFLEFVTIPHWLEKSCRTTSSNRYARKALKDPQRAAFVLNSLFERLKRRCANCSMEASRTSLWSNYSNCHRYTSSEMSLKEAFVATALQQTRPRNVLDVGCNTGQFSFLAAETGALVVSIDSDPAVVESLWLECQRRQLHILPLVIDICRPSPGLGWRNQEQSSFLDRAAGRFDLVMALAVIHHLLVSDGIPWDRLCDMLSVLTNRWVILEFITAEDPMFQVLVRGRENLFSDWNSDRFEAICSHHFQIIRSEELKPSRRRLYLLEKRSGLNPRRQ